MNDCFESVSLIQRFYNHTVIFQMGYSVTYKLVFLLIEVVINFYAKRAVHGQDFAAKFNLSRTSLIALKICVKVSP